MAIGDPSAKQSTAEKRREEATRIRRMVRERANKDNVSVPRTALNNFVDTYSKTRVGPIHRAIGNFFKGIRDEAVSTAKTQQAKNVAAKKAADKKFTPAAANSKKKAAPKGMADKKAAPRKTITKSSSKAPHSVVKGDTLSALAVKYDTTVAELKKLNNIKDVNKIRVGQKIKLPSRTMRMPKPKPKRKK